MLWHEVADDRKCQNKDKGRNGGQSHQRDVDTAMQLLPRLAMITFGEVALVVLSHLGGESGNIVSPAGEDPANHSVSTLTHSLECYRLQRLVLAGQHELVPKKAAMPVQRAFRRGTSDLGVIILL